MLRELNKLENLKKTLPAYQPLSSLGLFSHLFHEKTGYITPQKRPLIHLLHFLSDFRFFSAKNNFRLFQHHSGTADFIIQKHLAKVLIL